MNKETAPDLLNACKAALAYCQKRIDTLGGGEEDVMWELISVLADAIQGAEEKDGN